MLFPKILILFQVHLFLFTVNGNNEDIENLLRSTLNCINCIQRGRLGDDFEQERLYRELDHYTRTLLELLTESRAGNDQIHGQNVVMLETLYGCLYSIVMGYEATQRRHTIIANNGMMPPTILNTLPGRPRYNITNFPLLINGNELEGNC